MYALNQVIAAESQVGKASSVSLELYLEPLAKADWPVQS
jgi:hypothetical protein